MLCQILAEKLYKVGDGILMSGSAYTFNTLQLWAITERISLQKPNTGIYMFCILFHFAFFLIFFFFRCRFG